MSRIVLGRTVATLHNGPVGAGSVEARLPQGLPSGVYLVHAQGTCFNEATPLVLR